MKRRLIPVIFSFVLALTACGEKTLQKEEITIYHATDMHYISQRLTDNSPRFVDMIATGDGKMTHYIEPITEAFKEQVIANKPDYLFIGGDISFNGEKQSHIDFAQKLKQIEEGGTQVLVIPGNHDIDYPFTYRYEGDYYYKTDRITKEEFGRIYADYGLKQAYSKDEKTFSYLYKLTDKITALALDTNTAGTGVCDASTIEWLEKELKKMKEGTQLIVLTHQNLFSHFDNSSYSAKYTIFNNDKLIDTLNNKGIVVNLSGHIHTQHIYNGDNITDIATESIGVLPYNYGVLTVNGEKAEYKTQSVDVEGWAKENNTTDENLMNFDKYSVEFYMKNQAGRCMEGLEESGLSQEDKQLMADFFAELNIYYFSGTIDEAYDYLITTDGYKAWVEKGKDYRHYDYVMARMEEGRSGADHNNWEKVFNK